MFSKVCLSYIFCSIPITWLKKNIDSNCIVVWFKLFSVFWSPEIYFFWYILIYEQFSFFLFFLDVSGCFPFLLPWFSTTLTAYLKHIIPLFFNSLWLIWFLNIEGNICWIHHGWNLPYDTCRNIHTQSYTKLVSLHQMLQTLLTSMQKQIEKFFNSFVCKSWFLCCHS